MWLLRPTFVIWHDYHTPLSFLVPTGNTANEDDQMQYMLRLMIAAVGAVALAHFAGQAAAQGQAKQIKLTDKHIESFIAAQKDMMAIGDKMQGAEADKLDKMQAEFENVAKKHGFASGAEYEDVANSIDVILLYVDPDTKKFTDPQVFLKKQLEDAKKNTALSEADRKRAIEEIEEDMKNVEPVKFPENIALVEKHFDRLSESLR
jgi:hypothetical protein